MKERLPAVTADGNRIRATCLSRPIGGCREIQQLQTLRFSTIERFSAVTCITSTRDAGQQGFVELARRVERCFLQQLSEADRIKSLNCLKILKAGHFYRAAHRNLRKRMHFVLRSSSAIDVVFFRILHRTINPRFAIYFKALGMQSQHGAFRNRFWLWPGDCL